MNIYIIRHGEQFGPYDMHSAFGYMREGALSADDLAWHEGMAEWKSLKEVLGGMQSRLLVSDAAPLVSPHVMLEQVPTPSTGDQTASFEPGGLAYPGMTGSYSATMREVGFGITIS